MQSGKQTKIKAIFFDQDRTLIDTGRFSEASYRVVIEFLAKEFKVDFYQLFSDWQNLVNHLNSTTQDASQRSLPYSLTLLCQQLGVIAPNQVQAIVDQALGVYYRFVQEQTSLTQGTAEFFQLNLPLHYILFTEAPQANYTLKLSKFNLLTKFKMVINSETTGVMKPSLAYYQPAWDKFKLRPQECLYVGDNWEKDCQLPQEKGGVGVIFGQADLRADFSISDMMELAEIARNFLNNF